MLDLKCCPHGIPLMMVCNACEASPSENQLHAREMLKKYLEHIKKEKV